MGIRRLITEIGKSYSDQKFEEAVRILASLEKSSSFPVVSRARIKEVADSMKKPGSNHVNPGLLIAKFNDLEAEYVKQHGDINTLRDMFGHPQQFSLFKQWCLEFQRISGIIVCWENPQGLLFFQSSRSHAEAGGQKVRYIDKSFNYVEIEIPYASPRKKLRPKDWFLVFSSEFIAAKRKRDLHIRTNNYYRSI